MIEAVGWRWMAVGTFAVAIAALPAPSFAQSAPRKVGRGLAAMCAGFLELPGNMVAETRAKGPGEGIPLGFAKGLGMIVVRELVGVYEFLTAPFPLPEGYRPIIEPEFPWDYFDSSRDAPPPSRPPRSKTRTPTT